MAQVSRVTQLDNNNIRIRDDFYKFDITIPVNEYDVIFSFLNKAMSNRFAAENFTAAVFQIAASKNITAIKFIESLTTQNKIELSASIAYYLNEIRKPTTLLGVTQLTTPNWFAARNVVL